MKASEIMSRDVVTVLATDSIPAAARILVDHGFTSMPVTDDDGRLVGIVAESDLLRGWGAAIAAPGHRTSRTVAEVMTNVVESLTPAAETSTIVSVMIDERIRCIPITDGTGVVGIITLRDLLRALIVEESHRR